VEHEPPGRGRWIAALAWAVVACLAAGVAAVAFGWPSVWGERVTLLTYALPFPTTAGMLHVPGLALGAAAIVLGAGRPRHAALLAALGAGFVAAGAILSWDPQRGRLDRIPVALFPIVDGLALAAFAVFARGSARAAPLPRFAIPAALLLPLLVAFALQAALLAQSSTWRPATSAWDEKTGLETLDYFPDRNRRMPATLEQACALLARMAPDPYPGAGPPGGWPKRHRILRLFASLQASLAPDARPLVVYEWRPGTGEGRCSDLGFAARLR